MSNWRINIIFILLFLLSIALTAKLFSLQVSKNDFYKALSQGLLYSPNGGQKERGEIFLKNGEPLAINKGWTMVFASPPKVKNVEETAKKLSEVLNLPEALVLEKLKTPDTLYAPIKSKLTEEEIKSLTDLNLKEDGVYMSKKIGRYYPQETLASQVAGFLNYQGSGQYGLEGHYEEELAEGKDLNLTMDYSIQFKAESLLEKAKEELDIKQGQIIVLEPSSGDILALANFPDFNPNKYADYAQEDNLGVFQNGITEKIFEPGSVMKPITMAAALNEDKIMPETKYTDTGAVKIGKYTIRNYANRVWGEQTMTAVLERSINTGAIFAEAQIGHKIFMNYVEKFGLFEKTGIDLNEIYSENSELKKGYEVSLANASFGQGIEMTPIQLVRAYSAIANKGVMTIPHLVKNANGKEKEVNSKEQIILPKTASQVSAMMVSVIEKGYAKAARIPGYYVAGKSGTAQVSYSALGINKSGYSDETIQSFIGFAPAFSPKFLILVKLDNPKANTAEYSAMPIFRDLTQYIINYQQIPPDYTD